MTISQRTEFERKTTVVYAHVTFGLAIEIPHSEIVFDTAAAIEDARHKVVSELSEHPVAYVLRDGEEVRRMKYVPSNAKPS